MTQRHNNSRRRLVAWRLPGDRERGSVTVYAVAVVVALFIVVGTAVDGSRAAQAAADANTVAAEAARAGGQAIDPAAAIRGEDLVDAAAAVAAAQSYLAAAGVDGQVQVVGNRLLVDVQIDSTTTFLQIVAVDGFTLDGHGESDLTRS